MKNATITMNYPQEKFSAVRHYMGEKEVDMNTELEDALQKMYEKYVPKEVRAYLEVLETARPDRPPRPRRPASPTVSSGGNELGSGRSGSGL